MIRDKKVLVVMPAYNAAKTLEPTYNEIPFDIVDEVLLVDDASLDETSAIAKALNIHVIVHPKNLGYGGNQKSCYGAALERDADIVIMLHPDYQYTPKLITAIASLLQSGEFDIVLASRILGGRAMDGGMPVYKYFFNRILTLFQNVLIGAKLSEYHTGYRAYTREVLEKIKWQNNSNDFVFDNEFLTQAVFAGFRIGEITCPTKYFKEASSINFSRSMKYGMGCIKNSILFRLHKLGIYHSKLFI